MLRGLSYSDFAGGAQLLDQSAELDSNMALDLRNVRFGTSGELRRRPGWQELGDAGLGEEVESMVLSRAGGVEAVLVSGQGVVKAIDLSGEELGSAAVSSGVCSFAAFGAPTRERMYFADGDNLGYWDGSAFVVGPAVSVNGAGGQVAPRPRVVVVTPWDNRLMAAGFKAEAYGPGGAQGSGSTVFLSAFVDPDSWTSTHREQLTPGDGEDIVAGVAWRDLVFVFKQSRFFVFTSTTDAGGGRPRFNYYAVDAGCGAMHPQAVVAARDGVYFIDRKGVYRTQGEEPELLSWRLDPLFQRREARYFMGARPDMAQIDRATLAGAGERVYVGLPSLGGGWASWVYDTRFDWWSHDTTPMRCGCVGEIGGVEQLLFARNGSGRVLRHAEGIESDLAAPISARWRGSWLSEGSVGEKIVQRLRVWGEGVVRVGMAVDFAVEAVDRRLDLVSDVDTWGDGSGPDEWADGTDEEDTWGGVGRYVDGWVDYSWKGSVFSMVIRNVDGSDFSIQRVEHHVHEPRRPAHDSAANVPVGE